MLVKATSTYPDGKEVSFIMHIPFAYKPENQYNFKLVEGNTTPRAHGWNTPNSLPLEQEAEMVDSLLKSIKGVK
jgi:hypothetical protein